MMNDGKIGEIVRKIILKVDYQNGWRAQAAGVPKATLMDCERAGYAARMWAMRRPVAERVAQSAVRDVRVVAGV